MSWVATLEYRIEGGAVSWVVTLEYRIEGGGSVVGCYPRIPNRRRGQCRGLLP